MRLKLLFLVLTALLGLNVQAQNTPVEKVDSSSYEYIRLHAREKVMRFMDYYRAIAEKLSASIVTVYIRTETFV